MIGLVVMCLLAVGIGAALWWASTLPPTRPRPRSRHRGPTYMSVHRRLQRRKRSE